jgi:hypothetical protein
MLLSEVQEFGNYKLVTEGKGKELFIEGVFAQAERENRNRRKYPKAVMESAVKRYVEEYVSTRRAMGELSHPENRPMVKPELASHLTTVFEMRGDDVYGKAKILDTPQGQIVRGLLEGGVQLGVSTRALGSIVKESNGCSIVQPDFQLFAVDVVGDPSAHDAWVNAINESADWVVTDDGRILDKYRTIIKTQRIDEAKALSLFAQFLSDIRS